jgi:hypothetical protein
MFAVEERGRGGNNRVDDGEQGCQSQRDGNQQESQSRRWVAPWEGCANITVVPGHADELTDAVYA